MDISIEQTAKELLAARDVALVAHKSPDGDTLGSCFALYYALSALQKRVRVECSDAFPQKYSYFLPQSMPQDFEAAYPIAVDVADQKLLGPGTERYAGRFRLCIDHHPSNTDYAAARCLIPSAAATAQIVFQILRSMGAEISPLIADCLFTGLTTDTGCFRYTSVTPETHETAAALIRCGARAGDINRLMFEQKSKGRLAVERLVMESLEYHFDGRCALICISKDILSRTGAREDELEGVSSMPRQIEGVWAGVTLNERDKGYKISIRTDEHLDACEICAALGGGGHKRAAGCFVRGDFAHARAQALNVVARFLGCPQEPGSGGTGQA